MNETGQEVDQKFERSGIGIWAERGTLDDVKRRRSVHNDCEQGNRQDQDNRQIRDREEAKMGTVILTPENCDMFARKGIEIQIHNGFISFGEEKIPEQTENQNGD